MLKIQDGKGSLQKWLVKRQSNSRCGSPKCLEDTHVERGSNICNIYSEFQQKKGTTMQGGTVSCHTVCFPCMLSYKRDPFWLRFLPTLTLAQKAQGAAPPTTRCRNWFIWFSESVDEMCHKYPQISQNIKIKKRRNNHNSGNGGIYIFAWPEVGNLSALPAARNAPAMASSTKIVALLKRFSQASCWWEKKTFPATCFFISSRLFPIPKPPGYYENVPLNI